ncbi:MAG TPA: hypothetical protein VF701_07735 [Thermoanaerobaculia bacterium]
MIPALVILVWFPLVGAAVSRLLGRVPFFLAGAAASGMSLFVLMLVGVPLGWGIAILAICSALVLLIRPRPREEGYPRRPELDVLLVVVPVLAMLLAVTFIPQHDYDGTAFWMLKAKAIATEGAVDGPFFRGENTFSPRNQYPLLLPIDVALVMKMSGGADDLAVRWIFPLILGSLALEIRRRFRLRHPPAVATLCAGLLVWTPQFALKPEGGAMSAYSDIALAAFITMAFLELVDGTSSARFGFWAAAMVLTKSEGLPIAVLLILAGVWIFRRRVIAAAVPLIASAAALIIWRSRIELTDEGDLFGRLVSLLPSRFEDFLPAVGDLSSYALVLRDWGAFWVIVVGAVVVLMVRRQWRALILAGVVIVGGMALYSAVSVVSEWDRAELLRVTAARLLMHLAGPALYLIASASGARKVDVSHLDVDAE